MKQILIIPTWLLTNLLIKFIRTEDHPWYGRYFTLEDWADHATPLNYSIAIVLWIQVISIIVFLTTLICNS